MSGFGVSAVFFLNLPVGCALRDRPKPLDFRNLQVAGGPSRRWTNVTRSRFGTCMEIV
jgi:hypothetical protein